MESLLIKAIIKAVLLGLLLYPGTSNATPIDDHCAQFTAYGSPTANFSKSTQFLCRKNYAVIHSCAVKNPVAVMEHVTVAAVSGPAKRKDDFREDKEITAECRSTLNDYAGKPYDRGHMAPAANNTHSDEIMSESFLLSNMVPQVPHNNRGIWRMLEIAVRDKVKQSQQDIYTISGGIWQAGFSTIGNNVAVPTHLYKVIINKTTGEIIAYLMPNAPLAVKDLPDYRVSLEEVEKQTGLKFPRAKH